MSLPPVRFAAWEATCRSFGAAIAEGPGLVALAGPAGSGKTYTLKAFAAGIAGLRAVTRLAGEPLVPGTELDLVEDVGPQHLADLADLRGLAGARAVAIPTNLVGPVREACREVRLVHVKPMSSRDVRMVIEARREQLSLPTGSLTLKAIARLDDLCGGNPGRLDDLLLGAYGLFIQSSALRIGVDHVQDAAEQFLAETMARQAGLLFLGRTFDAGLPPPAETPGWTDIPFASEPFASQPLTSQPFTSQPLTSQTEIELLHPIPANGPDAEPGMTTPAPLPTAPPPADRSSASPLQSRTLRLRAASAPAIVAALGLGVAAGLAAWRAVPERPANATADASAPPVPTRTGQLPLAPGLPSTIGPAEPVDASRTLTRQAPAAAEHHAHVPEAPMLAAALPAPTTTPPGLPTAPAPTGTSPPSPAEVELAAVAVTPATTTHSNPAEALRLLVLAKTLLSINQVDDAMHLAKASAALGNAEAATLLVTHSPAAGPNRTQAQTTPQSPTQSPRQLQRFPAIDLSRR